MNLPVRTMAWLAIAMGVLALGGDCQTTTEDEVGIYALTVAPPGRVALVREADRDVPREAVVQLTRGVALAVRCWESCEYTCVEPTLVAADPTMLAVRGLLRQGLTGEFALVAVKTGTTTVTLETACGTKTYPVQIVE